MAERRSKGEKRRQTLNIHFCNEKFSGPGYTLVTHVPLRAELAGAHSSPGTLIPARFRVLGVGHVRR
jgi:hypothetical protein